MVKRLCYIVLLWAVLLLTGCNFDGKYEVRDDSVYFTYWTFSFGTKSDTLKEAHAPTFQSVKDWLGRDQEHVWFKSDLVKGADPATLKAMDYPLFYDKHDYYYLGKPINVADMSTFRVLKLDGRDVLWAVDSHYVYYDTLRIEGADPQTLRVLDTYEAVDKNHVYYFNEILEDADPETYKVMGAYSKDKNHVWYCGELIEGADAETFDTEFHFKSDKPDAHDKHGKFMDGRRINYEN